MKSPPPIPFAKRLLFSMLPLLMLGLAIELTVRLFGLHDARFSPPPLPGEISGLHQPDRELFWKMRPDDVTEFAGQRVATNELSLRSPKIEAKARDEYRILSLGESTTFGHGVTEEETYSRKLEARLNKEAFGVTFHVINAGVAAYSSFQSWKYLELRGMDLEPDMVLFYHELNDSLPTSIRDFAGGDHELSQSDWERYDSARYRLADLLDRHWMTYRGLSLALARLRIRSKVKHAESPTGLDWESLLEANTVSDARLPVRVPTPERRRVLEALLRLCRENGVQLVLIHPSYRGWIEHECTLTRFAASEGVPIFEARPSLHPGGERKGLFQDGMHPTARGHERLTADLADFLVDNDLVRLRP